MIKWCKCVKSYNTEKMFSNVPVGSIRPKQYFECFVGEKFRYKKIRMKNYFIDVPHPFIDYNGDVDDEYDQSKSDKLLRFMEEKIDDYRVGHIKAIYFGDKPGMISKIIK
jgi:hypothetical protein